MSHAGPSWRGYFPLHGELTSGQPDGKEGVYFGREENIQPRSFMRGNNLFPKDSLPEMENLLLKYLGKMEKLCEHVLKLIALALGLDENYFSRRFGENGKNVTLFRAFNYPKQSSTSNPSKWGVAEHTDMGLLTLLKQDNSGGLEIFNQKTNQWEEAPPKDNTFVVNIGDILEKWTHGIFIATKHRVRNTNYEDDRLSMPYFYDPCFGSTLEPIDKDKIDSNLVDKISNHVMSEQRREWDGQKMSEIDSNMDYESYLKMKVCKCFPDLFQGI